MTTSRDRRNAVWIAALLALAVIALYWPARHFEFIDYDDDKYVFNNPDVLRGLSWWGLVWSFVDFHVANYHPLTWLSHMLDAELYGLRSGGHHLTSVLLHSATSVLLFFALRSLTQATWRSAFVAALFALHPLRLESVAWISERKDVLSGLFFVLTVWAYGRYARDAVSSQMEAGWRFLNSRAYQASLICFLLGMLSKPMLMTVPAVLLLLDFWPLNRLRLPARFRDSKPLIAEKLPFAAIAFGFALLTVLAQSGGAIKSVSWTERLGNTLSAYWGYVAKSFWPDNLCILYLRLAEFSPAVLAAGAAALVLGTLAAWHLRRAAPFVLTGWLWFVIMLIPVSGVVPLGDLYMADRYSYLPSIGLAVIVVWGGGVVLAKTSPRAGTRFAVIAGMALVIACAAAARTQLPNWRNTETVMTRALQVNPSNFVAHINLGMYHARKGNPEAAKHHRARARELTPERERSQFERTAVP